jgi:pimeloyl-ACP methyl ester carboxylesterase
VFHVLRSPVMTPLVHDRHGTGAPLILVHGLGSRRQVWAPVIDSLAAQYEVFAIDLPGFGESAPFPPGERATVRNLAAAVTAFAQDQGLDRPHIAGNSLGGGIALELAAAGVVGSATALAPIGFWSTRERRWCQASMRNIRTIGSLARPALPALVGNPVTRTLLMAQFYGRPWLLEPGDTVAATDALIGAASFDDACADFTGYLAPEGAADRVPVTIAWGSRDGLLLPRQLNRARRRVPRARHLLLAGCGHIPMSDDPDASAQVIADTAT